jgi:hypothetical protein
LTTTSKSAQPVTILAQTALLPANSTAFLVPTLLYEFSTTKPTAVNALKNTTIPALKTAVPVTTAACIAMGKAIPAAFNALCKTSVSL